MDCLSDYCGCLIMLEDCVRSGVRFNWSLDWLCWRFSLGNDSSCRVGILMLQLFNCTRQLIPKCLTKPGQTANIRNIAETLYAVLFFWVLRFTSRFSLSFSCMCDYSTMWSYSPVFSYSFIRGLWYSCITQKKLCSYHSLEYCVEANL